MKFIYLVLYFLVFLGCDQSTHKEEIPYLVDQDTIVLQMNKHRGYGLFNVGAGYLRPRDSSEVKEYGWYEIPIVPDGLDSVQFSLFSIWMQQPRYFGNDTSHVMEMDATTENSLIVLFGKMGNGKTVIVDQNHNGNLEDDEIIDLRPFDWKEEQRLVECTYTLTHDSVTRFDTGWINVGLKGDNVLSNSAQHFTTKFHLNDVEYELGVIDRNANSLVTLWPQLALFQENGIRRDSLFLRDLVDVSSSIKVGDEYYKFEDFYSGSHTLVLTKDPYYESRVGVQIGMNAPEFAFTTNAGDSMSSSNFQDKNILIANVSGCTRRSYQMYEDILKNTRKDLIVIGVDSGKNPALRGNILDVEKEENQEVYDLFRNAYSSYDCYLIDRQRKIQDKFQIFDWQENLQEFLVDDRYRSN